MKIVILSGSGRYQDRWHDFTATSVEVAKALRPLTSDIAVRSFKPQGVQEVRNADLLVVNSGSGAFHESADGQEEDWAEVFETLRAYRAGRGPILALHAAANSLDGLAEWPQWIGGRWDSSVSMHPPIAEARVEVTRTRPRHPITQGLTGFTLYDELYSYLSVDPDCEVLFQHSFEGRDHALVWAVERDGARAVYDALGHDARSFTSAERVDLLRREAWWLTSASTRHA